MMQPCLILTIDYELFGNGLGCLERCVTAPTERILSVAEHYQVPATLFVEALEFIRIEQNPRSDDEAQAIERVKVQLRDAVARGHDVQLHLHPQWLNARPGLDGKWQVDYSMWRLGDLSAKCVESLISDGKAWLEGLIRPVRSDYRCVVFRAGAWCIQPSSLILQALKRQGFIIDSTVAPGLYNAASGDWYDFRHAPDLPWWPVSEDVIKPGEQSLIEVPIATGKVSKAIQLADIVKKKLAGVKGFAPGCEGSYYGPNSRWQRLLGYGAKFGKLGTAMLDISSFRAELLIRITEQWQARYAESGEVPVPIVTIGHNSNFTMNSEKELVKYLEAVLKNDEYKPSTYPQWADAFQ